MKSESDRVAFVRNFRIPCAEESKEDDGALKIHLNRHSGEKFNKCKQCDFASSRASNLRVHLTMHIGEKANKCNQCDFASCYRNALRRHLIKAQPIVKISKLVTNCIYDMDAFVFL